MMTNNLKPSDTKSWDIIKHESQSKHSMATKSLVDPENYNYYLKDGKWYPHRKPTQAEIVNNQFK